MDWSNERYVRLYVRDTLTWQRLGFEGQAVFCLLLRKVDRVGALAIDDIEPWEAVALHINAPEDFARVAMERLLRLKVVEHVGQQLLVPNFLEAQEASMSPTMRQKEHRLRRRDQIRSGLDPSQRETVIYFIQSEHGGEIKIGRADDVAKRLAGLQTSRPDKLLILAAAPGSTQQERELHDRFAAHRVKGEWFSPVAELMQLVADVVSRGSAAFDKRDLSQSVTGHETFAVTPSLAVPCLAVPSQEEEKRASAPPPLARQVPANHQQAAAVSRPPTNPVTSAHLDTLRSVIAAEADRMGMNRTPRATDKQYIAAAEDCLKLKSKLSLTFEQACVEVAQAALKHHREEGQPFGFALCEVDPRAPPKGSLGPKKDTVESLRAEANAHLLAGRKEAAEGCLKRVRELQDSEERRVRYAR